MSLSDPFIKQTVLPGYISVPLFEAHRDTVWLIYYEPYNMADVNKIWFFRKFSSLKLGDLPESCHVMKKSPFPTSYESLFSFEND